MSAGNLYDFSKSSCDVVTCNPDQELVQFLDEGGALGWLDQLAPLSNDQGVSHLEWPNYRGARLVTGGEAASTDSL